VDPYNPQNTVSGTLFVNESQYGDILIEKVNDLSCKQYIHVTPKFLYPGDVTSPSLVNSKSFPESFKMIRGYDKLDGTNICMFRYEDAEGYLFTSYKTRLVPFLKGSSYGNWIEMWNKMLEMHPEQIEKLRKLTQYNFGFEMFGFLNKILIIYGVPLDHRLLYAIDRDTGKLIDPHEFDYPKPQIIFEIDPHTNPFKHYEQMRMEMEERFINGSPVEGIVMYVHFNEKDLCAWKCKPPSVLAKQTEDNVRFIGFNDVYTTAMNTLEELENLDDLERETINLLSETYNDVFIQASIGTIRQAVFQAKEYVRKKGLIIDAFKQMNMKWDSADKKQVGNIMREITKRLPMFQPTDIFNMLKAHASIF
jgi:hypothetical protein